MTAAGGAYQLTAAALRPVERMHARAAAITPADLHPWLPVPPADDEIARLGATLSALLDRLHAALTRRAAITTPPWCWTGPTSWPSASRRRPDRAAANLINNALHHGAAPITLSCITMDDLLARVFHDWDNNSHGLILQGGGVRAVRELRRQLADRL